MTSLKLRVAKCLLLVFLFSCGEDEEKPACSFTFKNKKYTSNDVFCIEDFPPGADPRLWMKARGSWGRLDIDQRVNVITLEFYEPAQFFNNSAPVSISRTDDTLEFSASMSYEMNGVVTTGTVSGTCRCTEVK